MTGKKLRLNKLFNPESNRICIVPMDHGVTMGPIQGLSNTAKTACSVISGGANAIVVHKGLLKELAQYDEIAKPGNFILHISASTEFCNSKNDKCLVSTVEQAVKLGAMGVSVHVNLGADGESRMISDLGFVADACMDWGMPLLAMMYVRSSRGEAPTPSSVCHAARVAEELGADLVKLDIPFGMEDMEEIIKSIHIPIVISGGPKVSVADILLHIDRALRAGASGISIGRNIFQSKDPELMTNIICQMVHKGLSYYGAIDRSALLK